MERVRRQWLRNDFDPSLVQAQTFVVNEDPVILVATGLAITDAITIEVRADAHTTLQSGVDHHWTALYRNGLKVDLRGDNNQLVLIVPGVYRISGGPAVGAVTVALHEGTKINDDRIIFNDISSAIAATVSPPLSAPPPPEYRHFNVLRADATTLDPVTLVYQAPILGGDPALVGHILADGTYVAGPYPGTLAACGDCGCTPAVSLGELTSWG